MTKRKRGGQVKLDGKVQARMVKAIRLGMRYEDAAKYAGVSLRTWARYKARAELGEEPFASLLAAVKEAETEGMMACLEAIERAYQQRDWKAAAWILERRHGWWPNAMITNRIEEQGSTMDLTTDEGRAEVIAALQALPVELLTAALVDGDRPEA